MNKKLFFIISLLTIMLLSACGAKSTTTEETETGTEVIVYLYDSIPASILYRTNRRGARRCEIHLSRRCG